MLSVQFLVQYCISGTTSNGCSQRTFILPGSKSRSIVWTHFEFQKELDGTIKKSTLNITKAICCHYFKSYAKMVNNSKLTVARTTDLLIMSDIKIRPINGTYVP